MKLIALALSGLVAIVAATALAAPAFGKHTAEESLLDAVRAVTARYHSLEQAEQAGYVRDSPCVSSPAGGMGFHYLNPTLAADPAIDPLAPEILVYAPTQGGGLELVALEYFRRAADQTPPFDQSDKPSLFSRDFDGIMPEHNPGMGWHYDLHLWLWEANPSGLLTPFNPNVSCG